MLVSLRLNLALTCLSVALKSIQFGNLPGIRTRLGDEMSLSGVFFFFLMVVEGIIKTPPQIFHHLQPQVCIQQHLNFRILTDRLGELCY